MKEHYRTLSLLLLLLLCARVQCASGAAENSEEQEPRQTKAPTSEQSTNNVSTNSITDKCDIYTHFSDFYKYDRTRGAWEYTSDAVSECGLSRWTPQDALRLLRGKRLLFVGDSTVRNTALSLVAFLCNGANAAHCAQIALWPFQKSVVGGAVGLGGVEEKEAQKRPTGLTKGETPRADEEEEAGNTAASDEQQQKRFDALRCDAVDAAANTCKDELRVDIVQLDGLTAAAHYKTKRERKVMWQRGIVPPLAQAHFRDVTISVLEAGCFRHSDGVWKVLDHLIQKNRSLLTSHDVVIASGGMHCNYQQYRSGTWYLDLEKRWRTLRGDDELLGGKAMPVIWLEITHCLKTNAGHFFKYGKQWRLNYRKLVSCDYIKRHIDGMNKVFARAGVHVSPTRFMTDNISQMHYPDRAVSRNESAHSSCVFSDRMHPSVRCYVDMLQVHLHSLSRVLHFGRKSSADGKPVVIAEGEEGAHDGLLDDDASLSASSFLQRALWMVFLVPILGFVIMKRVSRRSL